MKFIEDEFIELFFIYNISLYFFVVIMIFIRFIVSKPKIEKKVMA